ncbi:MAG: FAD:protein FMN transferase [Actinomycetota bacterium]
MNTDIHLLVVGGDESLTSRAEDLVHRCEGRWSRFRRDSELSHLNAASAPVVLSADTYALIERAVDAWRQTGGVFDPSVLGALVAAGYDRSFETLPAVSPVSPSAPGPTTTPGRAPSHDAASPADIEFFPSVHAIRLPEGLGLDLGGIAKGATADAVAAELLAAGAEGCCVNVGGDVALRGRGPVEGGWQVELACPGASTTRSVRLADGAVCTSTTLKRRWATTAGEEHHLRDAITGASLRSGAVTVSLIGATATQTEVLTKVVLAAGVDGAVDAAARFQVTGLVIDDGGGVHELPGFDRFDATGPTEPTTDDTTEGGPAR